MQATRLSRSTTATHEFSPLLRPSAVPSRLPTGSKPHASLWRLVVSKRLLAGIAFVLLAFLPAVQAQSVTGQISGTVTDSTGAVVAGAAVKLTGDLSQQAHTFTTDANGNFVFFGVVPGSY